VTVPVAVPPAVAVRVIFSGTVPTAGFALSDAVSVGIALVKGVAVTTLLGAPVPTLLSALTK
jgi:hypothetical protein